MSHPVSSKEGENLPTFFILCLFPKDESSYFSESWKFLEVSYFSEFCVSTIIAHLPYLEVKLRGHRIKMLWKMRSSNSVWIVSLYLLFYCSTVLATLRHTVSNCWVTNDLNFKDNFSVRLEWLLWFSTDEQGWLQCLENEGGKLHTSFPWMRPMLSLN